MKFLLARLYRYGYPLAVAWWFITRPTTEGVRCIIKDGNRVLLIRHTYGRKDYTVPGGGKNKNESIEQTAARETKEEVGIEITNIRLVESLSFNKEFKKDTIHICTAEAVSSEITADTAEIKEAAWFDLKKLPNNLSSVIEPYLKY